MTSFREVKATLIYGHQKAYHSDSVLLPPCQTFLGYLKA